MMPLQPLVSEFTITGRLEDFVVNSKGRVKYLYVSTAESDYSIEVAKQKNILGKYLKVGSYWKITGMRKYELHREQTHYKAYRIELLCQPTSTKIGIGANTKTKVLVCQGSSCCKRGGKAIYESLQTELKAKGINNEVEIKATGCMKQCKQAPCLIMPGRNSYSGVQPQQISKLVSKYFL